MGYLKTQLLTDQAAEAAARQRQRFLDTYGEMLLSQQAGAVLEIGPGRGELLDILTDSEVSGNVSAAYAVDIDEEVANYIKRSFPTVKFFLGNAVDFLESTETRFAAVYMLHVLEHLEVEPAIELLRSIRSKLEPGGALVIEVPNNACSFVGRTIQSSDVTHKTAFTSLSLSQICRLAGFELIDIRGIRPKGKGVARTAQRIIVSILIAVDRLVHKVFLPAWSFLHEPTIYAVCKIKEK